MNKVALTILFLVLLAALGYGIYLRQQDGQSFIQNSSTSPSAGAGEQVSPSTDTGTPAPSAPKYLVRMTDSGFSPSSLAIKTGESVTFVNDSDTLRWPASGMHPTHLICPGFDALRGLAKGETYSFTFNVVKVCPFHDHLNPSLHGSITVQ